MRLRQYLSILLVALSAFAAGVVSAGMLVVLATMWRPEPKTLVEAAAKKQPDTAVRLILQGARPEKPVILQDDLLHWQKGDSTTPFLAAVAVGHINFLRFMLQHGVRLDEAPNDQALCVAARYGHGGAARTLMESGAPYQTCEGANGNGGFPNEVAARMGYPSLAQRLRDYARGKQAESARAP